MRIHRAAATLLALTLSIAPLAGCRGGGQTTSQGSQTQGRQNQQVQQAQADDQEFEPPSGYAASCPTTRTRAMPKTRALSNAGIAMFLFHRYFYKPWKQGTFQKGADGRIKAMIKAAGSGALIADQLRRTKNNIQADPGLCRAFAAPLDGLTNGIKTLSGKLRGGTATGADLEGGEDVFQQLQRSASAQGAGFTEHAG